MEKDKKEYWDEEWKSVVFKGINPNEKYEVSNYGRIRRWKKKIDNWKYLATANANGYIYYSFKSDDTWKVRHTKPVHRLVAERFVKKESEDHDFVIHKDFNKLNNYYENLEWVTRRGLVEHNSKNPKVIAARAARKGKITNSKLTEADVIRLKKKLLRSNNKLNMLAKEFGITHTQLNRIRRGINWAHVRIEEEDKLHG